MRARTVRDTPRFMRALLALACLAVASLSVVAAAADVPERIVAVGDVHGSFDSFQRILRTAELIDESGAWIGGNAVLVQTGDLMDRGPEVRAVLDFMRQLEQSAADGGGRLVSLLGNHEVYNLVGFFDYTSTPPSTFERIAAAFADENSEKVRKQAYRKWALWARKYKGCGPVTPPPSRDQWMMVYPPGFVEYLEALSARGQYGQWLRQRSVVARVGDTLFLHGGLSPEIVGQGLTSIDAVNARAREELAQFDADRELLETEGIALPFSTLGELHCALAREVGLVDSASENELALARRQRLREVKERLPAGGQWLLLQEQGPVWFRGYASWVEGEAEAEAGLETVLDTFGGKRVVVGHTPRAGEIVARFDGRIFLIDTAMAYTEIPQTRPAALEIRGDDVFALYEGERVSLGAATETAPSAMDEQSQSENTAPVERGSGSPVSP